MADWRRYTKKRILLLVFIAVFSCISNSAEGEAISCDFTGSGLDLDGSGVQPVYLSCAAGRVQWDYPRAALRLTFRYPRSQGEFHGCIKASPEFEGARLYIEGHRALIPLFSKDDGRPSDLARCFTSHNGQVSLFLEAEPSETFKKRVAAFEYDLQPMPAGDVYDPWQECRPCTDSELVRLFCSSDFAARGFITNVRDDSKMERTVVTLVATRVYQQTDPAFARPLPNHDDHRSTTPSRAADNHLTNKDWSLLSNHNFDVLRDPGAAVKSDRQFRGQLHMPVKCGAKSGHGEYLFLGSLRLGEPILRCAPKFDHWKKVVESARNEAHCVLET